MRIGIVTHYYENYNYGGNLQAFALCSYLNQAQGVEAEQIPCGMTSPTLLSRLAFSKLLRIPRKLCRMLGERLTASRQRAIEPLLAREVIGQTFLPPCGRPASTVP